MFDLDEQIDQAARAIRDADAVLIGAGAGMGVDSGLPDFRGNDGFWKAYPPFKGKRFAEVSNPVWFGRDPEQAWGFFGHRLNLYQDTTPHEGFQLLLELVADKPDGVFVFTSNVDGHFQRAGFPADKVIECHGSLTHLQCVTPCSHEIWESDGQAVEVDAETIRATSAMPRCTNCGGLARPNVLMFGDYKWVEHRCDAQNARYQEWLRSIRDSRLTVIELGAGPLSPQFGMSAKLNSARW